MDVQVEMEVNDNKSFHFWWRIIVQFFSLKIAIFKSKKIDKVQQEYFIYIFRLLYGKNLIFWTVLLYKYHFVDQIMENMNSIISMSIYTRTLLIHSVRLYKIIMSNLKTKSKKPYKNYRIYQEILSSKSKVKWVKILIILVTKTKL